MSIHPPKKGWFHAPKGAEAMWVGIALTWCMVMFAAMPFWHFKGKQTSSGESYRVKPKDFVKRVNRWVKTHKVGKDKKLGIPIVQPEPGGNAYLLGRMWMWYPIIKLKVNQTYRLHISSADLQHGFSLLPINMNFHILPGYDHVLTIKPTRKGTFQVICNEFCGIGHHLMTGKIIVE